MTTKLGFTKMTIQEFAAWIKSIHVALTITTIQQHHTYIPSYSDFRGANHFEMQQGMKNHHIIIKNPADQPPIAGSYK